MSQMSPSLLEELQKGNEAPGLFQSKRSNLNMLVNSQVLAHLQSLHEQAKEENEEVCEEGTTEEVLADREQLMERINNYNRRVALEAFKIRLVEETQDNKLDHIFEGVLRFYYARGQENLTKAVKLTNKTTVDSLLPELIEKFNINNHSDCSDSTHHLHVVLDGDEIRLEHEDTPLDLALNAKSTPRFVLRLASPEAMKEPQGEVTLADNEAIKVNENTDHEYGRRPSPDLTSGLANKSKSKYRDKTMITENGGKIEQIAEEKISGNKIGSRRHKRRSSKSNMEDENGHLDVESSPKSKSNGHPPQQGPAALLISMRRGRVKRDQSMERERTERGRSPSRERMRRSYRAAKDLLQRTFSLRKREDIKTQTELSVEECSPGVLKIFGDSICPGANYKSVLASTKSTAQELVKEALERYALPQSESSRYVLCDVVGKLSDVSIIDSENKVENVWTTECFRVIGDSERPLILQSLWKPTEGYSRRFEIRLREEVSLPGEVDNITSALNANARKMEIARTCPEAIPVEDIRKYSRSVSTSLLESQDLNCDANNEHNHTPTDDYNDSTKPLEFSWLDSHPPTAYPFLITLRGYNMLQDSLVYPLAEQVVMIGRGTDDSRKTDISLHAPDVSLQHCWMIRNPTPSESDIVSVDPLADAFVAINNCPVSSLTNIKQGDLLSIGEHYVFLFKDPTTGEEIPRNVPWLTTKPDHAPAAGNAPHSAPADSESDTSSDVRTDMKSERKSRSKTRKRRDPRKDPKQTQRETEYKRDTTKLKLPFKQKKEDELLQRILHLCNTTDDIFPLCPAYLFVMAVDYYAMKFDKYIVRSLVQKIAGLVQQEAWNKTKLLADRHGELLSTQEGATDKDLFRDLRGIVYWMSNALEMLNFFKKNLPNMMMEPCDKLQARTRVAPEKVDEEMLAVLEEVVMYTFQQTVYYLTKALYVVLPAILDTNPFQDSKNESSSGQCPPTLQDILSIFQNTLDALKANLVHPHVVSQLFCYLFFFSNASLINWVMEKGKDGQYFQWIQGAQLRGNLDHIENWCNQSGFYEEGSSYLKKINMVSNLLAMPKVQLLQSDWYSLRKDFSNLNPGQLHHLLTNYQLCGKRRPDDWAPSEQESEQANELESIMESFNNHPPLVLPKGHCSIDLHKVPDPTFIDVWKNLQEEFKPSSEEYNEDDVEDGDDDELEEYEIPDHAAQGIARVIGLNHENIPENSASSHVDSELSDLSSSFGAADFPRHQLPMKYRDRVAICEVRSTSSSEVDAGDAPTLRSWRHPPNSRVTRSVADTSLASLSSRPRRQSSLCDATRKRDSQSSETDASEKFGVERRMSVRQELYQRGVNGNLNAAIRKCHDVLPVAAAGGFRRRSIEKIQRRDVLSESWPLRPTHQNVKPVEDLSYGLTAKLPGQALAKHVARRTGTPADDEIPDSTQAPNLVTRRVKQKYSFRTMSNPLPTQIGSDTHSSDNSSDKARDKSKNKPLPPTPPSTPDALSQKTFADVDSTRTTREETTPPPRPPPPDNAVLRTVLGSSAPINKVHGGVDAAEGGAINPNPGRDDLENVMEVSVVDALTKTHNSGLRVLPLTTDDRTSPENTLSTNNYYVLEILEEEYDDTGVKESEMDLLLHRQTMTDNLLNVTPDDTVEVELKKGDKGLGLGLIDGLYTPLRSAGIYVRTLVAGGPAVEDGRLNVGDRILAVNGKGIVGADYQSAMSLIRGSGDNLKLLVAKGNAKNAMKVTSSLC